MVSPSLNLKVSFCISFGAAVSTSLLMAPCDYTAIVLQGCKSVIGAVDVP